jgi:hypothetical protein
LKKINKDHRPTLFSCNCGRARFNPRWSSPNSERNGEADRFLGLAIADGVSFASADHYAWSPQGRTPDPRGPRAIPDEQSVSCSSRSGWDLRPQRATDSTRAGRGGVYLRL